MEITDIIYNKNKRGDLQSVELPAFTDIYVHKDQPQTHSFIWPGPNAIDSSDPELVSLAKFITEQYKEKNKKDFRVEYKGHDFRVHATFTLGAFYLICRRMPQKIWTLEQCNLHHSIIQVLLSARNNVGGLMIVCGKPGNGKSTTCSALVAKRLEIFGGLCLTIEDPAEMPLHGAWGQGICLQKEVDYQDFPEAIRDAMRSYPTGVNNLMLIGEIRDPDTAVLALQSAVDGRLVLSTTHAGSVIQGIQRILTLASYKLGEKEARHLLAASMRTFIHQTLKNSNLQVQILMDTPSVVGRIMNEPLEQLKNDFRVQMNNIKLGEKIALRSIT